jgi:hypothetical protein
MDALLLLVKQGLARAEQRMEQGFERMEQGIEQVKQRLDRMEDGTIVPKGDEIAALLTVAIFVDGGKEVSGHGLLVRRQQQQKTRRESASKRKLEQGKKWSTSS